MLLYKLQLVGASVFNGLFSSLDFQINNEKLFTVDIFVQGSHRLEKSLNIQEFLEKSLKIKFALKST